MFPFIPVLVEHIKITTFLKYNEIVDVTTFCYIFNGIANTRFREY